MRKIAKYIIFTFIAVVATFFMNETKVDAAYCTYNYQRENDPTAKIVFRINDNDTMTFLNERSSTNGGTVGSGKFKASGEYRLDQGSCPNVYVRYIGINSDTVTDYGKLPDFNSFQISSSPITLDESGNDISAMIRQIAGNMELASEANKDKEKEIQATCIYKKNSADENYIKIVYDNRNPEPYYVEYSEDKGAFEKMTYVKNSLNIKTFPLDEGTCPSSIQVKLSKKSLIVAPGFSDRRYLEFGTGDYYLNIKESSIVKEEYSACTSTEINDFKKEEQKLFDEFLTIRDKYLQKIRNKEVESIFTTPEQKVTSLKSKYTTIQLNFERVYKSKLDKLTEQYKCKGLPVIDRKSEANYEELSNAYETAIRELQQEAIDANDEEAIAYYKKYVSEELNKDISNFEDSFYAIFETINVNWDFGESIGISCSEILGEGVLSIIQEIFNIIKIAAPILLILYGIFDFSKAVITNDNDGLKKASSNFIKRALAAIAIFFLPFIINLILNMPGIKEELNLNGNPLCDIGMVVIK